MRFEKQAFLVIYADSAQAAENMADAFAIEANATSGTVTVALEDSSVEQADD